MYVYAFTLFRSGTEWLVSGFRRFTPRRKVATPSLQKALWTSEKDLT
jgi:hypothetical protein